MMREAYVRYLRQQAEAMDIIADLIESGKDAEAKEYQWLVDLPLQTKFEEQTIMKEVVRHAS